MVKTVEVAVGVIVRNQEIFITKRADDLHQGGKWEFPGGKKEQNESMQQALSRELQEEVGIQVLEQRPLMVIEHDYGDKQVVLDVRVVDAFKGEPRGMEGQQGKWVRLQDLNDYTFPSANVAIIEKLQGTLCRD